VLLPEFQREKSEKLQNMELMEALGPVPVTNISDEEETFAESSDEEERSLGEPMLPWYARRS